MIRARRLRIDGAPGRGSFGRLLLHIKHLRLQRIHFVRQRSFFAVAFPGSHHRPDDVDDHEHNPQQGHPFEIRYPAEHADQEGGIFAQLYRKNQRPDMKQSEDQIKNNSVFFHVKSFTRGSIPKGNLN